jgi:hypothetical protein
MLSASNRSALVAALRVDKHQLMGPNTRTRPEELRWPTDIGLSTVSYPLEHALLSLLFIAQRCQVNPGLLLYLWVSMMSYFCPKPLQVC